MSNFEKKVVPYLTYLGLRPGEKLYEEKLMAEEGLKKTRNELIHVKETGKTCGNAWVNVGNTKYCGRTFENTMVTVAGCWVHCRRRFDEALKLISKSYQKESNAFLLMKQIQAIYREEGKLKDLSSDERLKQRQAVIKPLVDAFFAYLKTINVSKKDKFGDAVGYALNQEKYLRVFLTDGDVPIDNNASERAIRGFCIGKKNWQMIDTIHGAKSSAIIYSIVETAKANNLKPFDYVQHLLEEMPKHMDACIINMGAIVDHGCVLDDACHINSGAIVMAENNVPKYTNPLSEVPSRICGSMLIYHIRGQPLRQQTSDGLPHRTTVQGSREMHWIHTVFPAEL